MYTTRVPLPAALPSTMVEGVEFTAEEKHKQTVFAVSVAMCFLMVLILSIGHAAYSHFMEQRKQRRATEEKKLSEGAFSTISNLVPQITVDEIAALQDGRHINMDESENECSMSMADSCNEGSLDTMLMLDHQDNHDYESHLHDNNDYHNNFSSHGNHTSKMYMDTNTPKVKRKVSTVVNVPHMSHIREEFGT